MEPGLRLAGLPMAGSSLAPELMPWRGSRPRARSCGAKVSKVARVKPPNASGVAMSAICALAAVAGWGLGMPRVKSESANAMGVLRGAAAARVVAGRIISSMALAGFQAQGAELRRECLQSGAGETAERKRRGDVGHLRAGGGGRH